MLTINDLPVPRELDAREMSAVRGGDGKKPVVVEPTESLSLSFSKIHTQYSTELVARGNPLAVEDNSELEG